MFDNFFPQDVQVALIFCQATKQNGEVKSPQNPKLKPFIQVNRLIMSLIKKINGNIISCDW